ncbi:hypothetical protein HYX12_05075 [Candidatus Woesearchaeota archaeon]|nr:hypothetical protein [Candidatus Woesearchaeota archaeon]
MSHDQQIRIEPQGSYTRTELTSTYNHSTERNIVALLLIADVFERSSDGKFDGTSVLQTIDIYRERVGLVPRIAQNLEISEHKVRHALARGLLAEYFEDISRTRFPLYALREGKSVEELELRLQEQPESRPVQERIYLKELAEEQRLSLAKLKLILSAIGQDYVTKSNTAYRLKEGVTRAQLSERLSHFKDCFTLRELPTVLDGAVPVFPNGELEEAIAPYVDIILNTDVSEGNSGCVLYRLRKDVDPHEVLQVLEDRQEHRFSKMEMLQEIRGIKRLLFLQGRYVDQDYSSKIELYLRAYPLVLRSVGRKGMQELENGVLDEFVRLFSSSMNSERAQKIQRKVEKDHKVSLEGLVSGEGRTAFEDEHYYELANDEDVFTIPRLSGRMGLNYLELRGILSGKDFQKYLNPIGGSSRVLHYRLNPEKTMEKLVHSLAVESERLATKRVLTTATEGKEGLHRVMFLKARYLEDHMYQAKIDFLLRGQAHVLLSNGWQRMNQLENQMLDIALSAILQVMKEEERDRLVQAVHDDFGTNLAL